MTAAQLTSRDNEMTTYATITDLIAQEVWPAILTIPDITPERADDIADEVTTRMRAAGLIVWEDGYDETRGAYWLPAQGFRMVTTDDDGAAFWGVVQDVLADQDGED